MPACVVCNTCGGLINKAREAPVRLGTGMMQALKNRANYTLQSIIIGKGLHETAPASRGMLRSEIRVLISNNYARLSSWKSLLCYALQSSVVQSDQIGCNTEMEII